MWCDVGCYGLYVVCLLIGECDVDVVVVNVVIEVWLGCCGVCIVVVGYCRVGIDVVGDEFGFCFVCVVVIDDCCVVDIG